LLYLRGVLKLWLTAQWLTIRITMFMLGGGLASWSLTLESRFIWTSLDLGSESRLGLEPAGWCYLGTQDLLRCIAVVSVISELVSLAHQKKSTHSLPSEHHILASPECVLRIRTDPVTALAAASPRLSSTRPATCPPCFVGTPPGWIPTAFSHTAIAPLA
jgi:hypothetical protein